MLSFLNYIACKIKYPFIKLSGTQVYLSWFRLPKRNQIDAINSRITHSRINVQGYRNKILVSNCKVSGSLITIAGINNSIELSEGVNLRNANIIIRGSNCRVSIGKKTTFGGVRIVNVGKDNSITIGEECLFSDQIEIWASDTHAIYDEHNIWINREQPIQIGNNVWVGSRVTILKGVAIGNGAIIGMGSILTKDIGEKVVAVGYPVKTIKENVHWSLNYPNETSE